MTLKKLQSIHFKNKNVLLYADFNVPVYDGKIVDTFRIEKCLPTINYILSENVNLLLILSHFGRPDENEKMEFKNGICTKNTLTLVSGWLKGKYELEFTRNLNELKTKKGMVLLENTRLYDKDELKKGLEFVDFVVFDGFSVAHRPLLLPADKKVFAGLLVQEELGRRMDSFDLVILGGKKISDKIALIRNLKFKKIFFCGAMVL